VCVDHRGQTEKFTNEIRTCRTETISSGVREDAERRGRRKLGAVAISEMLAERHVGQVGTPASPSGRGVRSPVCGRPVGWDGSTAGRRRSYRILELGTSSVGTHPPDVLRPLVSVPPTRIEPAEGVWVPPLAHCFGSPLDPLQGGRRRRIGVPLRSQDDEQAERTEQGAEEEPPAPPIFGLLVPISPPTTPHKNQKKIRPPTM
jgi:hypothetical protein